MLPEAHQFTCGKCGKPVHPWEDECPFCGAGVNWLDELRAKYPEPDWFSKIFERNTSYRRWKKHGSNCGKMKNLPVREWIGSYSGKPHLQRLRLWLCKKREER